jgi:hypothetical protein
MDGWMDGHGSGSCPLGVFLLADPAARWIRRDGLFLRTTTELELSYFSHLNYYKRRGSRGSISIVTNLWAERLRFDSHLGGRDPFLFATASRPALRPTQPPNLLANGQGGALSPAVKRPWRKAHHLFSSSAALKNAWRYTSSPKYVFMA